MPVEFLMSRNLPASLRKMAERMLKHGIPDLPIEYSRDLKIVVRGMVRFICLHNPLYANMEKRVVPCCGIGMFN